MAGLLFDSLMLDAIIIGGTLLYILYRYSTATFNHWKDKGVPYLEPLPFFGNSLKTITLMQPLEVGLKDIYDRLAPHPYGGYYDLRTPMLLIRDPELLKQIMVKDFNYFQDRGFPYNDEIEPLSPNLVNVGGERWKNLRTKLTPAFSSGKLKHMFSLMLVCIEELGKLITEKIKEEGPVLELRQIISKFSTDVIGSCAFGLNCNCMTEDSSEFIKIALKFGQPSYEWATRRIIRFFLPTIADLMRMKDIPKEVTDFYMRITKETLEYREKNGVIRKDFMDILRQLKNKGAICDDLTNTEENQNSNWSMPTAPEMETYSAEKADKVFDDKLLSAQLFSFFIAGFETTSAAITFCLHELAVNPEIQTKLREEVIEMLKETDGQFNYEKVMNLPYLEKVACETLRKYPTAGHTLRRAVKPYIIPNSNIRINAGDVVTIAIYALQRDPAIYPDPDKFDPERFRKEEIAKRHPYAYIPFGAGPRLCIGMRFAIMELKLTVSYLISKFKFEKCAKTEDPLTLDSRTLFLALKYGAWVKVSQLK